MVVDSNFDLPLDEVDIEGSGETALGIVSVRAS